MGSKILNMNHFDLIYLDISNIFDKAIDSQSIVLYSSLWSIFGILEVVDKSF